MVKIFGFRGWGWKGPQRSLTRSFCVFSKSMSRWTAVAFSFKTSTNSSQVGAFSMLFHILYIWELRSHGIYPLSCGLVFMVFHFVTDGVTAGLAILTYIDRGQSPLRFSVISSENASYSGRGECQMIDDMGAQQAICTSWRKLLSKWQRIWRLYVICSCLSRSYFCAPTPQILKFLMER